MRAGLKHKKDENDSDNGEPLTEGHVQLIRPKEKGLPDVHIEKIAKRRPR